MEISRRWFSVRADADSAEISLFDEIGLWGVSVSDFKKELDAVKDASSITLLVNAIGGAVFEGMAIYSLLAPLKDRLTVKVLGLAASIASIIALAGKTLIMAEGSYFMIHDPVAGMVGTAEELRKTAELLEGIRDSMAGIYAAKTHKSKREIRRLMADETWLTAEEAVAMGFADSVDHGAAAIAARGDLSKFMHAPEALQHSGEKKSPPATPRDFERALRDLGYSRTNAERITARGFSAAGAGGSGERSGMLHNGLAAPSSNNRPVSDSQSRRTRERMLHVLGSTNRYRHNRS
jgi:ATP-dependent Clp protease protease subunit